MTTKQTVQFTAEAMQVLLNEADLTFQSTGVTASVFELMAGDGTIYDKLSDIIDLLHAAGVHDESDYLIGNTSQMDLVLYGGTHLLDIQSYIGQAPTYYEITKLEESK